MKKVTVLMATLALLCGNMAQADQPAAAPKAAGKAAGSAKSSGTNWMALGIGLTGLAVLGVVVGVTVASAIDSPSTFSH